MSLTEMVVNASYSPLGEGSFIIKFFTSLAVGKDITSQHSVGSAIPGMCSLC